MPLSQEFEAALLYAAEAHREQVRKGSGVPYLIHPLNVAKLLIQKGCERDVVVAGLMHDTVEDTWVAPAGPKPPYEQGLCARVAIYDLMTGAPFPESTALHAVVDDCDGAPTAASIGMPASRAF